MKVSENGSTKSGSLAGGAEHLRHRCVQRLGLLRQLGPGRRDVLLGAGVDVGQRRHHVAADPSAGEGRVLVGGVVAEREARRRREGPSLVAAERQQRPDDAAAPRSEPEQRPPPGARGEAIEHGLREVGARVAGGDPVEAPGRAERLGGGVAGIARGGLDVAGGEIGALGDELDAELIAEGAGGGLVFAGVGAEAVVQVQGGDALRPNGSDEGGGEAGRVGAAGDHGHARRALGHEAALPHRNGEHRKRLSRSSRHVTPHTVTSRYHSPGRLRAQADRAARACSFVAAVAVRLGAQPQCRLRTT